jgi:glyoxylase-like metal-dependent hydrolase (beta-lactamase superfamily II)
MAIPLEDKFNDIVGKAMRGRQLSDSQVAEQTGVEAAAVQALRSGEWNEAVARKVAPALGLGAAALAGSGNETYAPESIEVEGLAQFNTPFEDMTVNSYLVWDSASGEAVAFDTGADCSGVLELLAAKKLKLKYILLTHTHGDHIFDLDRLKAKTGAPAFVGDREPVEGAETFAAGRTWQVGALTIESRLTWGHSRGGITFVVRGLAKPIAVVGDAVFAGSMGGGGVSYADALRTNREEILTLPDETVIAPGHGPLTTVGEEKKNNPFFTEG